MTEISVVTPIYNEADTIGLFIDRVAPVLEAETPDYEILFVDDGSSDDSAAIVRARHEQDGRIRMIRLSRNYGKEAALTAGLDMAAGAAAIPMDADLQDPPELIPEMIAKWRAGADIVVARRRTREGDGPLKRATAKGFYRLLRAISGTDIPENVGDFRLIDRKALDALALFPERSRFMKGVFALLGFEQAEIVYERPARIAGAAKQNWRRLFGLALEGVVSFSVAPLRLWTVLGLGAAAAAVLYALVIVVRTLVYGIDAPGYASLITVVLFMNGLILIGLGVIGEYISRIFMEVKRRPLYLVRELCGVEDAPRLSRERPRTSTSGSSPPG